MQIIEQYSVNGDLGWGGWWEGDPGAIIRGISMGRLECF